MRQYYDNKSVISIVDNLMQHDWTKHIKIGRHFVKKKLDNNLICSPYIPINSQLIDVLTKVITNSTFKTLINNLRMENIYSPVWGGNIKDGSKSKFNKKVNQSIKEKINHYIKKDINQNIKEEIKQGMKEEKN